MVQVRDSVLPLVSLGQLFGLPHESDPCKATVVVIEDGGSRVGLVVDALLGKQEVVVKSLGQTFGSLGDGRIGLILDAHGIVELERGITRAAA
jgi:two-component system chemotaxis sensor kinase CheA